MEKMNLFEEKNAMTFDEFCKVIVEREKNFEKQPDYGFLYVFNECPINEIEERQLKKSTQFKPVHVSDNPRFIIQTNSNKTLDQSICYNLKGVFCDLGDMVVADFSFSGLLTQCFGFKDAGEFVTYLKEGCTFLLFHDFVGTYRESGSENIESFLNDLESCTGKQDAPCIVLSFDDDAEEVINFLTDYFQTYGIRYSQYDVQPL